MPFGSRILSNRGIHCCQNYGKLGRFQGRFQDPLICFAPIESVLYSIGQVFHYLGDFGGIHKYTNKSAATDSRIEGFRDLRINFL